MEQFEEVLIFPGREGIDKAFSRADLDRLEATNISMQQRNWMQNLYAFAGKWGIPPNSWQC
jgi:hypothetical protein